MIDDLIEETVSLFKQTVVDQIAVVHARESGTVSEVSRGIATVVGLPNVQSDELLRFSDNRFGFAFNLDRHHVGCVLLDQGESIQAGSTVQRTGRVLDTAVGEALIGRVIDPLGRPLDGGHRLTGLTRLPCERDAPGIMRRAAVATPLQTGLKVVDGLIPIGRGQRQLILGDRQTGKTSIAVDTIINQKESGIVCIYCSIGQRSTNVARVIASLRAHDAMNHTIVVVGSDDAPPGVQFIAPYAATTIGESFMQQGRDVLVVYDDLTSHARAYRHVSLLLRRPPGREAFPGDIFFVHSRLLERATHLRDKAGGGSLTAMPIVETEAQNVAGYIPTNLISITDGQLYLSPKLFHLGVLPAVDVGRSVSRVGGKTQLPAYRKVAGDLRLAYSQFEELEKFARFSSQLDKDTKATLERGLRAREVLKQARHELLDVPEQIGSMLALTCGALDLLPVERIRQVERLIHEAICQELPILCDQILAGRSLSADDLGQLTTFVHKVVDEFRENGP